MINIKSLNRRKNHAMRRFKTYLVNFFIRKKPSKVVHVESIQHLLFMRNDNKLGDLVLACGAFKKAHDLGYQVSLWVSPQTAKLVESNPYIDHLIIEPTRFFDKIRLAYRLRHHHIDLVVDTSDDLKATTLLILATLKAKYYLGFDRASYPLYDISIEKKAYQGQHMLYRYQLLFQQLQHPMNSLPYAIHVTEQATRYVQQYLSSIPHPIWVINPFAASHHRELSIKQLQQLTQKIIQQHPEITLFVIGSPSKVKSLQLDQVRILPENNLMHTVALIQQADLVLSPDTAIVHLATAFSKPLVALYRNEFPSTTENATPNLTLWGPNNPHATLIITEQPEQDISTLSVEKIYAALLKQCQTYPHLID